MDRIQIIKQLVYSADERFGDEPFIREYAHKQFTDTSYRTFRQRCDSLGVWIQEKFPSGVHAALIGSTDSAYLTAWFGIQCACCVSVPLDVANSAEKIADEINRSDSEMLFLDERHTQDIEFFKVQCPAVKYYIQLHQPSEDTLFLGDILSQYEGRQPTGMPQPEDLAAILFTSGTTGQSKGVMLRNSNLMDNATCEPDQNFHGDKRMTVLPVHHVFCFTCDILCSLWYGRTLCVNDSLMRVMKNLKIFQPKEVTFVPMIAASILKRMQQMTDKQPDKHTVGKEVFGEDFSVIYSGGAYLSPDIIKGYKEFGIEIAQGYGMTECSPRICTGVKFSPQPESVGRVVPGCTVKIVDGEIWVKSPSVMQGYYKNPTETANSLTEDGWLKTGDLGYLNDGYLYITGRKKNLIILENGENVSPEEIENRFVTFEPIKEMVVFESEHTIAAEIFPDPEYASDDIRAEIQAHIDSVNDTFPPAKRIVKVFYRDCEFEKTASKKILRSSVQNT